MAKYSSKPAVIPVAIDVAFDRMSNIEAFQERINSIPEEQRRQMGDVEFSSDSITLNTPQIGEIRFDVTERTAPTRMAFTSANSPVPLKLAIELSAKSVEETEVVSIIDIEIPAMLRPLIGGKMQEAADKFTELISSLNK